MVPVPLSALEPSRGEPVEEWPFLEQDVLLPSRSRQVCLTCHWFSFQSLMASSRLISSRRCRCAEGCA